MPSSSSHLRAALPYDARRASELPAVVQRPKRLGNFGGQSYSRAKGIVAHMVLRALVANDVSQRELSRVAKVTHALAQSWVSAESANGLRIDTAVAAACDGPPAVGDAMASVLREAAELAQAEADKKRR